MNYLTGTQVKIVEHPSKQFVDKVGILDTETPDTKKQGRFPVQIDEIGKVAWCKLDWLEVVTLEGEPAPEVGKADVSVDEEHAPILNTSVELLASTGSEAIIVGVVSADVLTLDVNAEPSDRPQTFVSNEVGEIELNLIELSGGTQSRASLDEPTLTEYVEAWERGAKFPPINLFFDGERYWLADGFHRVLSRKQATTPGTTIAAVIHQGTQRDAILASVGANARHGLKRSNTDKRRAVMRLLRDAEWSQWANRAIAQACDVDEGLVRAIKSELICGYPQIEDDVLAQKCGVDLAMLEEARVQVRTQTDTRTVQRQGKTYSINTTKLGLNHSKKADDSAESEQITKNEVGTFTSINQETNAKLNQLVKPFNAEQVGYDYDRNEAPAQVDDRPFAAASPLLVTTADAASPWNESAQFAVVVGNGIPIQVKYQPLADGERHLLNFNGPVDRSGDRSYYIFPHAASEEGSPQVLAQQLAENFYQQLQTSSPHQAEVSGVTLSEAIAPSSEECNQALEETEALKAERDELKQRLADANTEIERLKQEVQRLKGQLRMSA